MEHSLSRVNEITPQLTGDSDCRPIRDTIFEEDIVEDNGQVRIGEPPRPYVYEYITTIYPDNYTKMQLAGSEFESAFEQAVSRVVRGIMLGAQTRDKLHEYEWEVNAADNGDGSYEVQVIGRPK